MALCPNGSKTKSTAPNTYTISLGDYLAVFGEDSSPYKLILAISSTILGTEAIEKVIEPPYFCQIEPPQLEEISIGEIINAVAVIASGGIAGAVLAAQLALTIDKIADYVRYTKWFEFCMCDVTSIPNPEPPEQPPYPALPPCPNCYKRTFRSYVAFRDSGSHLFYDPEHIYEGYGYDYETPYASHDYVRIPKEERINIWQGRLNGGTYNPSVVGIATDFFFSGYLIAGTTIRSVGAFVSYNSVQRRNDVSSPADYGLPNEGLQIFDAGTGEEIPLNNPDSFGAPKCVQYLFTGACSEANLPQPEPADLPPVPDLPEDTDVITVAIPTDCGIGETKTYQINLVGTSKAVSVSADICSDCGISQTKNYNFTIKE